jgi:hypothetical protein
MQLMEADNISSSYDPLPHNSGGFGKEPFGVQNLGYIWFANPFSRESFGIKIAWKTKVGKQWVNQTMDTYTKIDRTFIS